MNSKKLLKNTLIFLAGVLITIGIILTPWGEILDFLQLDPFGKNIPCALEAKLNAGQGVVYIDGKNVGKTPFRTSKLSKGKHTVKIKRSTNYPGFYSEFNKTIKFLPGATVYISWELGPSEVFSSGTVVWLEERSGSDALLSVTSDLDGIKISIDGVQIGETPLIVGSDSVSAGEHTIGFQLSCYVQRSLKVNIDEDYLTIVDVHLAALPIEED